MKTYIVNVQEVHIQQVEIQAKNKKQAIEKVLDGEGDYVDNSLEYDHTLDNSEEWVVEEA